MSTTDSSSIVNDMTKLTLVENEEGLKYDPREHINIVFIGHVDAGKSTLCGQMLYRTGQVDDRMIEKYEKEAKEKNRESWYWAFIMDCSEEEKEKGKTVDVARAHFETKKKRYTILDAPGHRGYVPNMIVGASQADVAVLVISARKGEFETGFDKGGQTREHTTLAKTLGITKIVVVINKIDESTVKYSQKRFDEIVGKLKPFLKKTGYKTKDIVFVPVSGMTGENLLEPMSKENCPWYTGKTLTQTLDDLKDFNRKHDGPLRIPIIDKYKDRGMTVILGKIENGTIKVGQTIQILPNKNKCEVVSIKLHEIEVGLARTGENVEVYLKGIDEADVISGHVICDDNDETVVPVVKEFIAQLVVLDKPLFSAGYSAVIHIHTAVEEVKISKIMYGIDKKTGKKADSKVSYGRTGDLLVCKMELEKPLCFEKFETLPQLGRFTIRESKTIMVGKVEKIKPVASI